MKKFTFVSVLAFMALIIGCAHYPGGIAPSTTPLEGREYAVLRPVSATDSKVALLGIIPLSGSNTTREAIDEAAAEANGDALIDVTVEFYSQFWILFTVNTTVIEGKAIKFTK